MWMGGATLQHPDHLAAQLVKQRGHDGTSVGKSRLTRGKRRKVWNHKKNKKNSGGPTGERATSPSTDPRARRKTACCVCMCGCLMCS